MNKLSVLRRPKPPLESVLVDEAAEIRANLLHLGLDPSTLGSSVSDRILDAFLKMIKKNKEIPSCAKVAHSLGLSPSTVQNRCQKLTAEGRMRRVIGKHGLPAYIPKVSGAG